MNLWLFIKNLILKITVHIRLHNTGPRYCRSDFCLYVSKWRDRQIERGRGGERGIEREGETKGERERKRERERENEREIETRREILRK